MHVLTGARLIQQVTWILKFHKIFMSDFKNYTVFYKNLLRSWKTFESCRDSNFNQSNRLKHCPADRLIHELSVNNLKQEHLWRSDVSCLMECIYHG